MFATKVKFQLEIVLIALHGELYIIDNCGSIKQNSINIEIDVYFMQAFHLIFQPMAVPFSQHSVWFWRFFLVVLVLRGMSARLVSAAAALLKEQPEKSVSA